MGEVTNGKIHTEVAVCNLFDRLFEGSMQKVNEFWHTFTPAPREPASCPDNEKCLGSSGKANLSV